MKSFGHWFDSAGKDEEITYPEEEEFEEQDSVTFVELLNELGMSENDIEQYYGDYE